MPSKFTILVPTRDRLENIKITIEQLLKLDHTSFTILISDNCSTDGTYDFISRKYQNNEKIKLIQTSERLPMSLHWDFAVRQIDTEFFTILGDDDGLYYDSLTVVEDIFLKNPGIDFIRTNTSSFVWPSEGQSSAFYHSPKDRIRYSIRSTERYLDACMWGASSYTQLPMLYNGGFIRTKILANYFKENPTAQFYRSINPDVYSAIYLSNILKSYIYVYNDLAVNGTSRLSNGVSSFTIEKSDKKAEASKFSTENASMNLREHPAIPATKLGSFVPAGAYFVYESYYQWLGQNYRPTKDDVQKLIFACKKTCTPPYRTILGEWEVDMQKMYNVDRLSRLNKVKFQMIWLSHKRRDLASRVYNRVLRRKTYATTIDESLQKIQKLRGTSD